MTQQGAISDYYDDWVPDQVNKDVNLRHTIIFKLLKRFGLRPTDTVLEIGCGIGQVSSLIISYLKTGQLTATDISPASISAAKLRNDRASRAKFLVSDMTSFETSDVFDVIVLPDVLEHIPIDQHRQLFELLSEILADSGFIFIHIPSPRYLSWKHANEPDDLQIVDQVLHSDKLIERAYAAGLYLEHLQSHSIFSNVHDYQYIVFRKDFDLKSVRSKSKYVLGLKQLWGRLSVRI